MSNKLQVPAMRGAIGDWVYYVSLLPFAEATNRIKRTDEIHSSALLREMIQRAVTPRSKNIAEYLKSQPQRFFNAIVVGVYGGDPEWHQLEVKKSELFDPSQLENRVASSLGVLTLRGDEKLFAIDGQHRVEGIKEFIRQLSPDAAKELEDEVCAIFVSHRNSGAGLQRTRRLFATLNRYAKPVSLTELIALDEDDVVAITCRDLLETHPLFRHGRVSLAKGKALSRTDKKNITSLQALYQTMDILFAKGSRSHWLRFKTVRPSDDEVAKYIQRSHSFWNALVDKIKELKQVKGLAADAELPSHFRDENGGDFLFRAIAFPIIARCIRRAKQFGIDQSEFIRRFAKVPRQLAREPWLGVLWDGTNMAIGEKNQSVAEAVVLWLINADRMHPKTEPEKLKKRLGELLSKPPDEVVLPKKLFKS
jgi:DNA sulfur modification protein DndB